MKIVTWNVNSIRQRESHVSRFLERVAPDVVCLQEIKCEDHLFPAASFRALGYDSAVLGQKGYNGVAILCRTPFTVTERHLPTLQDDAPQSRYIEIETQGMRIGNLYLPNGNSNGEAGYAAKLAFMDALARHATNLLTDETDFVLTGDYNVCPTDEDLAPGALPATDALVRPETRAAFRRLIWLGLTDALRALHPSGRFYTFWDYQAGAWQRDIGLRIDHALLSPRLTERLSACEVERDERAETQPSDHAPVSFTLV